VFRGSILQSAVPDELRGRMQGVFTVVVAGGPRLADLLHGVLGGAFGSRATITGGGVAVIAGTILLAVFVPSYRHYRAPEDGEEISEGVRADVDATVSALSMANSGESGNGSGRDSDGSADGSGDAVTAGVTA
jgi:hypothetical protein